MRQLHRKVLRDLWHLKTQVLSIALVLASGIAALVAFLSTQASLKTAQARFYHEGRFADVFADLKRAPLSLAKDLETIPGVVSLETRIVRDFLLDLPDRVDSAVGRFISLPDSGEPRLNRLYLRQGRLPDPARDDEVIISEGFATANGFKPGDAIGAIVNGKYKKFQVVGTALSPEYIYAIRGATPIPDDRHFGIFWTPRRGLEAALDMEGSFNSLSLILGPGSSPRDVIARLDRQLLPYGGLGAYDREDQVSHRFLSDEINQQKVMAIAIPLIFLSVAAFLLNVVLSRLVLLQRPQIATLKAVGYADLSISWHYFLLVTAIVILGLAFGIALGVWMGRYLTEMYTDFYHFPIMQFLVPPWLILLACAIAFGAALLGVFQSLRKVFALSPAEGMRPPSPPSFHENAWERLRWVRRLSNTGKMTYRNLTLRPFRTAMGILGVAFAVMVTMIGMFWWDTIHYVIFSQFSLTQREDAEVVFADHQDPAILSELENIPGVMRAEGYRTVPIRLKLGHRQETTALTGYPADAELRVLLNKRRHEVPLPAEGLLLTQLLARKLRAQSGDWIEVEVLEGRRQRWRLPVSGIVDQWIGYAAYMDQRALKDLLHEDWISSAALKVDPSGERALQAELKNLPKIAAVNFKDHTVAMFRGSMVRFILVFATALTAFALVIAVGVVYNNARVALSERSWELMSLRVLGFTRAEVFKILGTEMLVQILLALPAGWLLGYAFAALLVKLMHTEAFEIPLIVERSTFAYASSVVLLSGAASAWIIRHRLDRTNLVEALKVRE
ncbi:ABC transporter permease [Deltaproteobacteria bacterium PRO3]|nr:ABC transporter permease [Deltaproteobacteria bacterium PRO3]